MAAGAGGGTGASDDRIGSWKNRPRSDKPSLASAKDKGKTQSVLPDPVSDNPLLSWLASPQSASNNIDGSIDYASDPVFVLY